MGERENTARGRRIVSRGALVATLTLAVPHLVAAPAGAAPATAAAVQVGVVSSMVQVRPDSAAPPSTPGAQLVAARGEYESFQVVVTGSATGVSVTGDLFGWGTTAFAREDYDTVTEASDREGATGRWADRLVPSVDPFYGERRNAFPLAVPAGQNRAVWVDVFVPLGTAAATYQGTVSVTASGLTTTRVPVRMRVLPIDLPATSSLPNLFTETIDGAVDPVCLAHTGVGGCPSKLERAQLHSMYARLALENRVTLGGFGLPRDSGPDFYPKNTWEQIIEAPLISGTGGFPASASFSLDGPRVTTIAPYAYNPTDHCQQACARAWKAEATEPGQQFAARVLWYGCDEANDSAAAWQACDDAQAKANAGWRRPALVTGTISTYYSFGQSTGIPVSTLVPNIVALQPATQPANRTAYDQFLRNSSHSLWLYSSCNSYGCAGDTFGSPSARLDGYPGYAIDAPANQARAMSWMVDRFRADGELYYSYDQNLGADDLFDFGVNGDGTLFYPGLTTGAASIGGTHSVPLESIRLKRIRDGREDYEYLVYLRQHGKGAAVDDIVASLYPRMNSATADRDGTGSGSLLAARTRLIAAIDDIT